jgi:putative FmdB family regulatory protein
MPIYEYRCTKCEHEFEAWQKMSDPPIKVCPKCHAHKVEKLVSLSSFQLKGSGWYATDYGGKNAGGSGKRPKSEAKAESSEKSSSEKSSGEKSSSEKSGGEKSSDAAKGDKGGESKASSGTGGTPRLAAAAA